MAGAAPGGRRREAALLRPEDGGASRNRVRVPGPEGVRDVDSGSGAPAQHCQREEAPQLTAGRSCRRCTTPESESWTTASAIKKEMIMYVRLVRVKCGREDN